MIGSPAALATQPQSMITSFHLPPGREGLVRQLTHAMPNLTIVDTGAITAQIQTMIGQVVQAVQFLFLFTLAAGCVVLYAAMGSVRDERVAEVALRRPPAVFSSAWRLSVEWTHASSPRFLSSDATEIGRAHV